MKKSILFLIVAAITVATGCRKIEVDGETVYVQQPGGGNGGPTTTGQTIYLTKTITADTTLRSGNTYILQGPVVMDNDKTMTIEPGTVIKGSNLGSDVGFLVITRGAKLIAKGTVDKPIVFTSAAASPRSGDWGGIVICGKSQINTELNGKPNLTSVEGLQGLTDDQSHAGSGDANPVLDDNSGVLSYVRIEYAGYAFQNDKEINSLTMAAVGSKTQIDHIQVSYAKDDAYEWFGGTVNAKYLISYKTLDDDFDTDNGYAGNVQFGIVLRDSLTADASNVEAFESDNNSLGTSATPKTSAVFSNITAIGPRATLNNIGSTYFLAGAQIRRNSAISIFNSVIMGWPVGILIDASKAGVAVDKNIEDSTLRIRYTTLAGNNQAVKYAANATPTGMTDASLLSWFTNPYFGNAILTNATDAKLIQPFSYSSTFDPTPFGSSPLMAATAANFTDPKVSDEFFSKVSFRGAIPSSGIESGWWKDWTKFNY